MHPTDPADPKSHENHAASILRIGHAEGTFERELVLFRDALRIDFAVDARASVSPIWGPFVPFFEGHKVAVEQVSGVLSRDMLADYIIKAMIYRGEGEPSTSARLFILCHHLPQARLEEFAAYLTPGPVSGSWQFDMGLAGQVMLCAASHLPEAPGHSFLRLAVANMAHAEHLSRIHYLLTDETCSVTLREIALRECAMSQPMVTDESFPTTWRELVETYGSRLKQAEARGVALGEERGIALGEERGEARGEASARQATLDRLLEVAATMLPAETIEALRAKGDPVEVALAMAAAGR
jgi:hypothetical protein